MLGADGAKKRHTPRKKVPRPVRRVCALVSINSVSGEEQRTGKCRFDAESTGKRFPSQEMRFRGVAWRVVPSTESNGLQHDPRPDRLICAPSMGLPHSNTTRTSHASLVSGPDAKLRHCGKRFGSSWSTNLLLPPRREKGFPRRLSTRGWPRSPTRVDPIPTSDAEKRFPLVDPRASPCGSCLVEPPLEPRGGPTSDPFQERRQTNSRVRERPGRSD